MVLFLPTNIQKYDASILKEGVARIKARSPFDRAITVKLFAQPCQYKSISHLRMTISQQARRLQREDCDRIANSGKNDPAARASGSSSGKPSHPQPGQITPSCTNSSKTAALPSFSRSRSGIDSSQSYVTNIQLVFWRSIMLNCGSKSPRFLHTQTEKGR